MWWNKIAKNSIFRIGIIGSIILFLFAGVVLILLSLMPCMELCEILKDEEFQELMPEVSISDCKIFKACNLINFTSDS